MDQMENRITSVLQRGWTLLLLRGIAAIAFGILTWAKPTISLSALVLLFGVYAFIDGTLTLSEAIANRQQQDWWLLLFGGIIGIVVGVLAFTHPSLTALSLLMYIAVWAIGTGVVEILIAVRIRQEVQGEWRLIVAGLVSVAFGALLIAKPGQGALTVLWLIGLYAVAFGAILVMLAFKARSLSRGLART